MLSRSAYPRHSWIAGVTLFLVTAAFTLWQNTRVAVLWDISFLLDTSYRFSLGQLPYSDLPFPHAPLTFLLHAGLIRLFGRVYLPHILCAAVEAGAATVLTWRILLNLLQKKETVILAQPESPYLPLSVSGNHTWTLATLLAVPLAALGIYSIYPHPIYDSDCVLAVLAAIFLLQRADSPEPLDASPRSASVSLEHSEANSEPANASLDPVPASVPRNLLAGAACVLPLFFKQNIGLPFLLFTLAAVTTIAVIRYRQRACIAPQLWLLGSTFTTLATALLLLHITVSLHNYMHWTIAFAGQRRLPGLGVTLDIYRQPSLFWSLPAAIAAVFLLRSKSLRGKSWPHLLAFVLLAAPFLWTIAALALTADPDDRAAQLLSLWPHLLVLAAALALSNLRPASLRANPQIDTFLPLILLATIHGTFLSQQLWGSTYAIWPLLTLLIAALLLRVPSLARPLATVVVATFLLCGSPYAISLERLSYIHLDGAQAHATLPQLRGLTTPGPWIPSFEELVRATNSEIPANDGVLLLPGEDPFFFATGRVPRFPILMFDPTTDPYTPQQTLDLARARNIRWLIVKRELQLTAPPPGLPEILLALQPDFTLDRTLTGYDIYRRK